MRKPNTNTVTPTDSQPQRTAMWDNDETDLPKETGALIDYILSRYHERHRAELAELIPLARRVERVHADDPDMPRGLARALSSLAQEIEDHMTREERILFPAMRDEGRDAITRPIAVMRADHEFHARRIAQIRDRTRNLTPPAHACQSWRRLCSQTAMLLDDLSAHMALENDRLFPRFEAVE